MRKGFIVGGALVVGVLLVGVLTMVSFAGKWFDKGVDVVSPDNVSAQYESVIEGFNSVQAAAENACQAGTTEKESGDPVLVEDPATAYAALVRSQVVDYNSRQANIFKAGKVGPPGYPKELPRPAADEDMCTYADEVASLRD